jgi:hypothetical protein
MPPLATRALVAAAAAALAALPRAASAPLPPSYDTPLPSVVRVCVQPYAPFVLQRVRRSAQRDA